MCRLSFLVLVYTLTILSYLGARHKSSTTKVKIAKKPRVRKTTTWKWTHTTFLLLSSFPPVGNDRVLSVPFSPSMDIFRDEEWGIHRRWRSSHVQHLFSIQVSPHITFGHCIIIMVQSVNFSAVCNNSRRHVAHWLIYSSHRFGDME